MDDSLIGLGGDGGSQVAETWVVEDTGEFLGHAAVIGGGLGRARVDGVFGVGFEVSGTQGEGIVEDAFEIGGWVGVEQTESRGEGATRCAGGLELVDGADHVHDTAVPDLADELCTFVGNDVGWSRFDTNGWDDYGGVLLGGLFVLLDHFSDPRCLTRGVDVVSTVASACFDDGRRVQVVRPNGVDDDFGLLGQGSHLRGRNASRDDRRRRAIRVVLIEQIDQRFKLVLGSSSNSPLDAGREVLSDILCSEFACISCSP